MKAIQVVLTESIDRVVYVSPTKALVNQLYIEIKNRFRFCESDEEDGEDGIAHS
jgi:superfamily II RNA helicase